MINRARYFSSETLQNHLIYFLYKNISKSLGLSGENIENTTTSASNFALTSYYSLLDIKFNGNCLINDHNDPSLGAVNLHISYTLGRWSRDLDIDVT